MTAIKKSNGRTIISIAGIAAIALIGALFYFQKGDIDTEETVQIAESTEISAPADVEGDEPASSEIQPLDNNITTDPEEEPATINSDQVTGNTILVEEFELGNPDAAVTVIEYASFTCPHCANFHREVWPELKANYVDTGKIRFIYRPVYFDGPGLWADMVARCGGQDRFFGIAGMLYDRQNDWSRAATQAEVGAGLQAIGRLAGLDDETILACMQDNDSAQALVAAFQENITRDNIEATPTFLINGELTSNMSYASFSQILDEKLAE